MATENEARERPATLFPVLVVICAALALWSALGADDKATWAFEVLPLLGVLLVFAGLALWKIC